MMIVLGITVALIILLITTLIILRKRKKCASCSLISESKTPEPVKQQKKEAAVAPAENIGALPQDSILRRHYFTHLCSMLEALVPPRPTESVLCRHYDMMIVIKIAQCLNDKSATEQLICDYEQLSA
jgi:hypothetical protein